MALQDQIRSLASVPALRDLEPEALRLIAFSADTRILRAGDVLFRENDPSDGAYVILSGSLALETGSAPAFVVHPPALVGETALVAETIRPATALAREPASVLKISRDLFRRVLEEFPDSAMRLRQGLAARLQTTQRDLNALRTTLGDSP